MAKQTAYLESQVRHFERKEKLDEMKKRLDGVLADWNVVMDLPSPLDSTNFEKHDLRRENGEENRITTRMFLFVMNWPKSCRP